MSDTPSTGGPWTWHNAAHDDGRNNGSIIAYANTGRAVCVAKAPQYASKEQWAADAAFICELERENAGMRRLIQQLLNDLPANRDWLNPDYERMMRDLCGEESARTLNPKTI